MVFPIFWGPRAQPTSPGPSPHLIHQAAEVFPAARRLPQRRQHRRAALRNAVERGAGDAGRTWELWELEVTGETHGFTGEVEI